MKFFSKLILLLLVLAGTDHTGFAQEFSSPVVQQYDAYRKTHFREKVYLHSDKQFYLAGEIIWFKAYAVDAAFHRPAALSKTGYIELLDRLHQPVMQVKIALDSGQGKGSFFLPSSIESGHYYIRAYTALMKNYGAGNFFEKQVTIINSLKSPTNILHDTTALQYALQLLPEGGQLVQGLESRIGFKISDMYGKGVTGKGVVINSRHDTLVHFTTLQFGMGSFRFTPVAGETYTAVAVLDNGQIISAPLPAVAATGYTMQVDHTAGNMLRVTVRSNNTGTSQQEILLMAHTRQDIRSVEKKYLRDGAAIFSIPSSGLGDGII